MRIVALALTLVLLAACGGGDEVVSADDPRPSTTSAPSATPPAGQRYTATTTVLESPEHGPQLCLGGVLDSYPPQCGGPDVLGWDWSQVSEKEEASGTTWGEYTVVGTWDGTALTLTGPPSPPVWPEPPDDDDRFATPCPTPDGGWRVVDPDITTDGSMQTAIEYADAQPDVGAVWIDQSINPAAGREPVEEERMNDPRLLVLNATFTGDLDRHEAELRERWGGALCVSEAAVARADLESIRAEVEEDLGSFLSSSTDEIRGRVEIGLVVEDGTRQQRYDERYGEGVVLIGGMLRPVDG